MISGGTKHILVNQNFILYCSHFRDRLRADLIIAFDFVENNTSKHANWKQTCTLIAAHLVTAG